MVAVVGRDCAKVVVLRIVRLVGLNFDYLQVRDFAKIFHCQAMPLCQPVASRAVEDSSCLPHAPLSLDLYAIQGGREPDLFDQTSLLACKPPALNYTHTFYGRATVRATVAMADSLSNSKSSKVRSRQSIAHLPSSRNSALKDNVTTDIAALQAQHNASPAISKRSRGKSIGPGGLEALTESTGNIVKVI